MGYTQRERKQHPIVYEFFVNYIDGGVLS